jgi:hypothetical protein
LGVVINYQNPGLHSGTPLGKVRTASSMNVRAQ